MESKMVNTQFKMMFYNQNDEAGLVVTYDFQMSNAGVLNLVRSASLFKPQNYVWNVAESAAGAPGNAFSPKVMALVVWVLISLFWSLYAFIDFLYRVRLFLIKQQFELDLFKYVEYWLLINCIVTGVIWL